MNMIFEQDYFEPVTMKGEAGVTRIPNKLTMPAIYHFEVDIDTLPTICWLYAHQLQDEYGSVLDGAMPGKRSINIVNFFGFGPFNFYRIECNGSWRLSFSPIANAPQLTVPDKLTGEGDAVIRLRGNVKGLDVMTNPGDHRDIYTFTLQAYSLDNLHTLVSNAAAGYSGELILPEDTFLLVIDSQLTWRIIAR